MLHNWMYGVGKEQMVQFQVPFILQTFLFDIINKVSKRKVHPHDLRKAAKKYNKSVLF